MSVGGSAARVGTHTGASADIRPGGEERQGGERDIVIALAAIVAAGAALRFATLGTQSFWYDEAVTVGLLHKGLGAMLRALPHSESTPPLYYLLAWVWARVFGFGEVGLRSLSALLGVATIPVAYLTGARLLERRAGLIVALLAATSPLLLWFSQEARSYALLVLLCAGSLALLPAAMAGRHRALAWWSIVSVLALATHYFAAFVVAPEALWLLVAWRGRRGWRAPLLAVAFVVVVAAALVPLALAQRNTGHAAQIAASAPLSTRLEQVPKQYVIGFHTAADRVLAPFELVIALLAVVLLVRNGDRRARRGALIAGSIGLVAVGLALVLALAGLDYLTTRNLVEGWLPFAIVVGAGLVLPWVARRRGEGALARRTEGRLAVRAERALAAGGVAALVAVGLVAVIAVDLDPAYQRDDWRGAARALGQASVARAIVVTPDTAKTALALYRPGVVQMPASGARVQEIDIVAMAQRDTPGSAAVTPHPPTAPGIPDFKLVGRDYARMFTLLRYRADAPVAESPSSLAGYKLDGETVIVLSEPAGRR